VPVTFEAVPVVFWLSVGTSAAAIARNVGTPAVPFGADRNVLALCDAKLDAVTASVPPSVRDPEVVTVPLRLSPLTVPVPPTEVTVPAFDVKPEGLLAGYAPKAVKAAPAEVAPVPPLAIATVPVTFDAVPVVFWLRVGNVQFVKVPEEGVPSAPPGTR
jgi:hypothetical protein